MKKKQVLISILCIVIAVILYQASQLNYLLLIVLFVISFNTVGFKKIVKYDFRIKLILFWIVILFYILNVADAYYVMRADGSLRSSMGFSHPNVFGIYVFSLCAEFLYLYYKRTYRHVVLAAAGLGIAILAVSWLSGSRTAVIGLVALIILVLLDYTKLINKILGIGFVKVILKNTFLVVTALIFGLIVAYNSDNSLARNIDSILSNRVTMTSYYMRKYNINLFGQEILTLGTRDAAEQNRKQNAKVLDNSYAAILLRYGLVGYIFYMIFSRKSLAEVIRRKHWFLLMILVLYLNYAAIENILIYLQYNIFLLYPVLLFNNKDWRLNEKNHKEN